MTFSIPELTRQPGRPSAPLHLPVVDLPGAVRRLCHQGAAVSAAHLAAAGPHAGAGGRQRAVGRRAAEDRHAMASRGSTLPMLPDATAACAPWMLWLSVIGIIYGALVALAQTDMKRLIAYSSVSHLGFCMLGLFALEHAVGAGERAANGQPRAVDRRPVRPGRHDLRPLPHPRDRQVRRPVPAGLPLLAFMYGAVHVLQHRAAGAERLRRRVRDPAGHVPAGVRSAAGRAGRASSR